MNETLFRSDDLVVRARLSAGAGPCVVTFDAYTDQRTLDREGFGEQFFAELGVDAIHVLSRQNDWYQYPELLDAAAAARAFLAGRERVVSYGSSMGGYAAIRFGGVFGASVAAAFSPQFSIDPATAPFEKRWIGEAARIDFCLERVDLAFTPKSYVFYDPQNADRLHVGLFRARTQLVDVAVPLAGHPCTTILAQTKVLRPIVAEIVATGEIHDFQSQYRAGRLRSPQFFFNLSMAARRPRARALLAERSHRLQPDPMHASHYGQMLAQDGRFDQARGLFEWSLEQEPDNLVIKYRYSEYLEAAGAVVEALDVMDRIFAMTHDARAFRPRREHLSKRLTENWQARFGGLFARAEDLATSAGQELPQGFWRRLLPARSASAKKRTAPAGRLDADDYGAPAGLEPDVLLTTVPAPPQFATSWRRHLDLLKRTPHEAQDVLLFGDSLVEWWPDHLWEGWRTFNFGVAGDRIQHLLWRVLQLPDDALVARCALVVIGTNNLGAGDSAAGIVAGAARVAAALRRKARLERLVFLEIPPIGADFAWRSDERRRANEGLRALPIETLDAESALIDGCAERSPNYASDWVHFSDRGYEVLTRLARERLAERSPATRPT